MPRPKPIEPVTTCTIKVPARLYAEFQAACQRHDATASVVLRSAMRAYLLKHPAPAAPAPVVDEEDI
jgi:hypothetical protein